MKRDPRVDPRPGDVVRQKNGITRHVEASSVSVGGVCIVCWRVGPYSYAEGLRLWRELNADAEIVKVAE